MKKRLAAMFVALILAAMTAGVGGCNKRITANDVRSDMSPELQSVAMTREQRKNRKAHTFDTNLRQVWDDVDSLLLQEKPLRLSEYNIP